jgi:hypothetical protein
MERLFSLALEPNKRRQLPPLDYSGSLLLRWQILLPSAGIAVNSLRAVLESQQTIDALGFLERGSWEIPAGDMLYVPLAEISYSPLFDWFITTPSGFKNSQLHFFDYSAPVYQIPNTGQSMSISFPPNTPQSTSSTITTVSGSTTSTTILAANSARMSGLIVNGTNKTLWVNFGTTPATTAAPSLSVPQNANIDIPDNYIGAVQGICSGTPTGSITITEFNAS